MSEPAWRWTRTNSVLCCITTAAIPLTSCDSDAVLNDLPLPERIAHRTGARPQTAKPARSLQVHTRPMGEPSEVGLKGDIEYTQDNRVLPPSVCCSGPSASQSASHREPDRQGSSQTWTQAGWEAIAEGNSAGSA